MRRNRRWNADQRAVVGCFLTFAPLTHVEEALCYLLAFIIGWKWTDLPLICTWCPHRLCIPVNGETGIVAYGYPESATYFYFLGWSDENRVDGFMEGWRVAFVTLLIESPLTWMYFVFWGRMWVSMCEYGYISGRNEWPRLLRCGCRKAGVGDPSKMSGWLTGHLNLLFICKRIRGNLV